MKGSRAAGAAVTLALVAAFALAASSEEPAPSPRVIPISAKRFEFTPKEVHVRMGEPVILRLTSEDVTHGFLSKKLKLDADIRPGRTTDVPLTAEKAGTYPVICDVFCGSGHGGMKLTIVVDE